MSDGGRGKNDGWKPVGREAGRSEAMHMNKRMLRTIKLNICKVFEEVVAWCGVVWCGVVWCGVVWCGVVWCGVVWCSVV